MKILENLWQSSETFGNLRKQFKSVFYRFYDILKFSENLRKSLEAFGDPEIFGKLRQRFKSNFQMFMIFLYFRKIFGSVRKSSEIFGKLRKRFKSNF